jgi:hypothetical protein
MTSLLESTLDDLSSFSVGCLLTLDLLYWILSGASRFGSSLVVGIPAVGERIFVYLLLLPAFVLVKTTWIAIEYPGAITGQLCPRDTLFDLDWFTIGVFGTALPLTLERMWMWIATIVLFFGFVYVIPNITGMNTKIFGVAGVVLVEIVGRFAPELVPNSLRFTLQESQVTSLMDLTLNLVAGPIILGALAVVVSVIIRTRELRSLPYGEYLPDPDPAESAFVSAATGTLLFLLIRGFVF